jgi:hypothetical protein
VIFTATSHNQAVNFSEQLTLSNDNSNQLCWIDNDTNDEINPVVNIADISKDYWEK